MKFSVLISLYDKENPSNLNDALESIYLQTVSANQIVLVKDGPINQDLEKIIGIWQQKFGGLMDVVSLNKNVGLARALNAGIAVCKYDWIARMDTDDVALSQRFEIQVNVLKKNPHISVLGSWISEHDESMGATISTRKVPETHLEILKYSKRRCPINHMTVFFQKKAVMSIGGYPHFDTRTNIEDYVLWAVLLHHGYNFMNIQKVLVKARTGSSLLNRRGGREYIKIEKYYLKKLKEIGFMNTYEYRSNLIMRFMVRLAPSKLRGWIYTLLRQSP